MNFLRAIFFVALVAMVMVTAATASERGDLAKPRAPLSVHLNAPNALVTDGGLMRVTGYLNNTSKRNIRYLDIFLTRAADDGTLDILGRPRPDLAEITKAIGLRRGESTGLSVAVSLVKPGKNSFALWVRVPDRAKDLKYAGATFFCLRMTVQQITPGKPFAGFWKDSNGICGQYVVKK